MTTEHKPHSELRPLTLERAQRGAGLSIQETKEIAAEVARLRGVEEQFEAQRQRVIRACRELEEAGSDPAPLRVVLYALDEDSIPAKKPLL